MGVSERGVNLGGRCGEVTECLRILAGAPWAVRVPPCFGGPNGWGCSPAMRGALHVVGLCPPVPHRGTIAHSGLAVVARSGLVAVARSGRAALWPAAVGAVASGAVLCEVQG